MTKRRAQESEAYGYILWAIRLYEASYARNNCANVSIFATRRRMRNEMTDHRIKRERKREKERV